MAKHRLGILALITQIVAVRAGSWTPASSTTWSTSTISPTPTSNTSISTTPAPTFIPTEELLPPDICGYVNYDEANSYTCASSSTCLWNSHLSVVGCGEPSSINFITSCVPYRSLGSCDSSCSANPSILRCNSASPHCGNPRIGPQGNYSIYACIEDRVFGFYTVHLAYDGQTTVGHLPRYLGDDSQITYGTVYPTSILPTGNPNASMTSSVTPPESEVASSILSSLTTTVDTATAATSTESDHDRHRHNETSPQEMYEEAQMRKEIIVGTVIGGFMFLLVTGLLIWIMWAWLRRRKNLRDEEEKREGQEFDLGDMDAGMLAGSRGESRGGVPTPILKSTSTPGDIRCPDP